MVVAGAQYPRDEVWPENIEAIEHVAPAKHAQFYGSQRFTLNLTRAEMKRAGYSPSVRLFEAAACGTPIISDEWRGLEAFFRPGRDILVSSNTKQTLEYLHDMPEIERLAIAANGRERVLRAHTSLHRAKELEDLIGVITTRSVRMAESADSKQISLKVAGPGD
jgi:spore maturation protein CgeB